MGAESFDVDFKLATPPPGVQDWIKGVAKAFSAGSFQLTEGRTFCQFHIEFDTIEKAGSFAKAMANVLQELFVPD